MMIFHCRVSLRGGTCSIADHQYLLVSMLPVFSLASLSDEKICRSYLKSITTRSWRCHLAERIDTVSELKDLTHILREDTKKRTLGNFFRIVGFAEVWGTGPQFYVGKIIDECSWHFFWVNQGQTPQEMQV